MSTTDIKEVVKEKYGEAALRVTTGGSSCCGATAANPDCWDPITSNLYDVSQIKQIPERRCKPLWAAETPPRWRNSIPAR